ncbi:MAG: threonine synthase [Gammaproteobacteria bacterium]|nr:threonine synthase [Gammaproteobacteria bacterium]NNC98073.1 threonine synthase [Gammaproteobacteria bacterium]NNM14623.1 threonine synthase [Gammaproteobacteria bacterium]
MRYYNLKDKSETVSFGEAIQRGLGSRQGLFMPEKIPEYLDRQIERLLEMNFVERSIEILAPFVEPDIDKDSLTGIVTEAFNFPIEIPCVNEKRDRYVMELFHGPSLAFKDFGARFLARCLDHVLGEQETTILTATSGDTGAAVAHAFFGQEKTPVVVLYPKGKISILQEKLFCTLGYNIQTLAVDGDFDACQAMVKQAFSDDDLRDKVSISTANSINVARLLAQICYYFEILAQRPTVRNVCVPSGNFGNVTAGLMAKAMGLPIERFLAATNANDTVPRFFETKKWDPRPTVETISNAMDVARPNNFPRVSHLAANYNIKVNESLFSVSVTEQQTREMMQHVAKNGYIADPHTSLALFAAQLWDHTAVLGTAHPAKFLDVMSVNGIAVDLPDALAKVQDSELLSIDVPAEYAALREILLED